MPDFWKKGKLILLSKVNNSTPNLENTRPISILQSIAKAFEISMLSNLEQVAYRQGYIFTNQRGFTPNMNIISDIDELLNLCQKIKIIRIAKWSVALVLIDLHRAYDDVDRSILFEILKIL